MRPPNSPEPDPSAPLRALGWNSHWTTKLQSTGDTVGTPGRVLRHDGSSVLVATAEGTSRAHLRPSVPPLAVGDWITLDGEVVQRLLERSSLLQRRDPSSGLGQLLAANVDVVGIVCAMDRPVSIGRIERFSAIAWDAGAAPLVILSKTDLLDDTAEIEREIFSSIPGSEIMCTSSSIDRGIDELLAHCRMKTLVLVGESGAGKSTLLNAMAGESTAATGAVRESDGKGRHTTTARYLHLLPGDCCLIDTPGVREVGLFTDVGTVDEGFDDVTSLAALCRFNDCEHSTEPDCAVRNAIDEGSLDHNRFVAWQALRAEAASAMLRADKAAYRKASRAQGKMYRNAMELRKKQR